ncbi:MAG: metal-dependent hydrolase [Candidatus Dojkabacteria bacterium]
MLIAHAPLSYIANELIQKKGIRRLKISEQIVIALSSMFFGILPDFDFFLLTILKQPDFIHHDMITHTPIFYILVWVFLKVIYKPFVRLLNNKTSKSINIDMVNILINTFLISTLLHLFADVLVSNLMFFYPIFNTKITILREIFEPNLFAGYTWSPLFATELVVISFFLLIALNRYFKINKIINIIAKVLIAISLIYIPVSIYINMNTYNNSTLYDASKHLNYDTDYDGVIDHSDENISNKNIENILIPSSTDIFDSALNIINSKKWTGNQNGNRLEKLKYYFGGIDSYRLVSQTYYDLHLPIEPVLQSFYAKKNQVTSYAYRKDLKYTDTLFSYFYDKNLLLELNLDSSPNLPKGKIFFIVEKDKQIINLGITLDGNYAAIVLEDDKQLEMHSYKDIREYYSKDLEKIYITK